MIVASDFSGVGSFNQGLNFLGLKYDTAFACEWDKFSRRTYLANYGTKEDLEILETDDCKRIDSAYYKEYIDGNAKKPSEQEWKYVRSIENKVAKSFSFYFPWNVYQRDIPVKKVDFYATTTPCQAFSIAGKRLGKEDRRGILFFNSHEFIQVNKPRYFTFENVKGLLSHDKEKGSKSEYGKTFSEWITLLGGKSINGSDVMMPHEDAVPYHIYFKVMNAKKHGVPQNRERIFIIGIRDDQDNEFSFPKEIPLEKRLKDVLEDNVDEKYFLSENNINALIKYNERQRENNTGFSAKFRDVETTKTMDALKVGGGGKDDLIKVNSGVKKGYEEAGAFDSVNFERPDSKTRKGRVGKGISQTIDTGVCIPVLTPDRPNKRQNERRFKEDSDPSFTITAQDRHGIYDGLKIRRLTPLECFRLMDFPDSFVEKARSVGISDSQLYKQAGNSVVKVHYVDLIKKLLKIKS